MLNEQDTELLAKFREVLIESAAYAAKKDDIPLVCIWVP